jgi:ornithine cyclodeaminase/alanine dehydrogenase-like protein (mu-crystallin family)
MSTLLLTRGDIAALLTPADYLTAVERAFRLSAQKLVQAPPPMHMAGLGGAFHAKGASLMDERKLCALKLNGNFPGNLARGLPTIQGLVLLCDAENGAPLALMDSIEITLRRTAAASALAARHLARKDATTLAVIGCGDQARPQAAALAEVIPLESGLVFDLDPAKAQTFAAEMSRTLGRPFRTAETAREAAGAAAVIVTCTTSPVPVLTQGDVMPGTFIAAVGADSPNKSEITPALMAQAKVVADVLDQCLTMGDLHHAVAAGAMTAEDVHAELAEVLAGTRPGRESPEEVIIFDSTGTAIQDVASAALAYQRARLAGAGTAFSFA